MSVSLPDRAVLITGATHGIGRGIVEYFVAAGARVVVSGRDETAGSELEGKLLAGGAAHARFVAADLSCDDAPQRLVDAAVEQLGGLDVIVNSAGVYPSIPLAEVTVVQWNDVLRLNLTTSLLLLQAALPALRASGSGRFIAIGSITGPRTGFSGLAHYGASKAGLEGFIRSAAVELAPSAITVNSVAPGSVMTPSLAALLDEQDLRLLRDRIPTGRVGQPADIAAAAAFLASTEPAFITGQALVVDGGQTLPEIQ